LLKRGIIVFLVNKPINEKHIGVTKIIVTKYLEYINFQDETGLIFSHSIQKSYTIKNIKTYLLNYFNSVELCQ